LNFLCIREILGRNIIARAKNGTGKTAAYVIPTLELIDTRKDYIQGKLNIFLDPISKLFYSLSALVLVPTRELALQTSAVIKDLGKHLSVECMVSTGGTLIKEDIYRLQRPVHVIVGELN
jgi:ATP-dependent RNA helicase DDX6/DHH1